jgi:hypothetical protein
MPILEPNEELRFPDNVLEVNQKLTNTTCFTICTQLESWSTDNGSYNFSDGSRLSPKATSSMSITLSDGKFRSGDFFMIWTMHTPGFAFKSWDHWDGVWWKALKLGLTTYNRLECMFEAKPE